MESQNLQQSEPQPYANITVSQPVLQKPSIQNVPPFTTYLLSGRDPHGEFSMRRRFRQFLLLRNKLVDRFIGIYIPPIPSKRAPAIVDDRFIEERRRFLEYFCKKISNKPYLFDSDIFQTFIRGDPDFQRAERFISSHQYALITNIYDIEFKQAASQADMPKVLIALETQSQNLKFLQRKLTIIRKEVADVIESKRIFIAQYRTNRFTLDECFRTILPRFQKEILNRHTTQIDSFVFSVNDEYKSQLSEYLHFAEASPLYEYLESLAYDIRQSRAFLQAIQSRKVLENKKINFESARRQSKEQLETLKAGRLSIKSIFTSGNKEQQIKQLENYIPQYERNETFIAACLPLSAIAIYNEIQAYKRSRHINFFINLSIASQKQIQLIAHYGNMMKAILLKPEIKSFNSSSNSESIAEQKQQNKQT